MSTLEMLAVFMCATIIIWSIAPDRVGDLIVRGLYLIYTVVCVGIGLNIVLYSMEVLGVW